MGMIKEADNDDTFNRHLMKIQDAIEALEKLEPKLMQPVNSQVRALELSAGDLQKLADKLTAKRK